jgi:glycosyltransferase involved in cell wall biosynthesis
MNQLRLAYISFDTVPAPKGAAIHIVAFARTLASAFGEIQLVTVSPNSEVTHSQEFSPGVVQTTLPAVGDTLIHRVLYFRAMLENWWKGRQFDVIHLRSIYEGFPIAVNKEKFCKYLIFEVNGLPSIELKYRYPAVADDRELLHKLRVQEKICLDAADLIVTPSTVTRDYLQTRGVASEKICVIPNGVELSTFTYSAPHGGIDDSIPNPKSRALLKLGGDLPAPRPQIPNCFRLLYFGTLSAWQGVNLAIEALALANQDFPTELIVIGQGRSQQLVALRKLVQKLKVQEQLTILETMSQVQLVQHIHQADAIVAPLTPNDRNLVQGCCPLKVLEGMASGTPVIASDMPVVRELGTDGEHFLLVKPGSAKAIKDAVLRLIQEPELAPRLAIAARKRIEKYYTWQQAGAALVEAYTSLMPTLSSNA